MAIWQNVSQAVTNKMNRLDFFEIYVARVSTMTGVTVYKELYLNFRCVSDLIIWCVGCQWFNVAVCEFL